MLTVFGRASFQRLNICPASENIPDCLLSHFYRFLKFSLLRRFSTSACSRFSSIDAPFEHMTASGGSILAYPPVAEASAFRLINHRREEIFHAFLGTRFRTKLPKVADSYDSLGS